MNPNKYLTVGALTKYLKYKFDNDENLQTVFIKGEISNFKYHSTGHLYFSIKDETSKINAIMFSSSAKKLNFNPVDGTKVLVVGRITIYEATGNYQIYIDEMQEDGVGNLYVAFEKLKEKLSKEGLFDNKYKKKIPKYPSRIGIVTAPTGAAIKDILTTIKRRYPICETILFPSLVQGENAKEDIVRKIQMAQNYDLDVLIVGRGGGSIEDLWAFNEEIVARAIFASTIPIISAVGHEIDYTIADFVADLRAPTPTAAAELAVPNINDLIKGLEQFKIRCNQSIYQKVNMQKMLLEGVKNSFVIKNPNLMFENKKQTIDLFLDKINNALLRKIENNRLELNHLRESFIITNPDNLYKNKKQELIHLIEKLEAFNPLNVLKRGFTITSKDNDIVRTVKNIKTNDTVNIKFKDGLVSAIVKDVKED